MRLPRTVLVLSPTIVFSLLVEFGDIWMMRKLLMNLPERTATRR